MNKYNLNGEIDVVVLTLNSERTITNCLDAIQREISVRNVIIVDGGSTDKTVDLIKKHPFYNKIKLYTKPELSLFESRVFGYRQVKTPIYAGIDSDCIIKKGWYKEMISYMEGDIGVVEGGVINHLSFVSPIGHEKGRGYTFNNLFLKDAVKDIPDVKLITKDDNLVKYYVEQNGYKWHKSGLVLADHYSHPVRLEGSKTFIFRIGEKKELIMSAGKSDRLAHNHIKIIKMFLNAFYTPLMIWLELMRRWVWHFIGWLYRK